MIKIDSNTNWHEIGYKKIQRSLRVFPNTKKTLYQNASSLRDEKINREKYLLRKQVFDLRNFDAKIKVFLEVKWG